MKKQRATILQKLVHFLTAFSVVMKAIAKMEHPQGYWPVIVFFLLTGIYIVVITLLHDRLHAHTRLLDATVYALESVVTATVAYLYFAEGARGLPWVFAIASIGFAIATVVRLVKRPKEA